MELDRGLKAPRGALVVSAHDLEDAHIVAGTSLAASNWLRVGETAGRGRYAASGTQVPAKAVWLYPLARDWRSPLGVPEPAPCPVLGPMALS